MPKHANYLLGIILLLALHAVKAQESDTLYIQQDPLVVKKQVIVEVTEPTVAPSSPWFVALEAGLGKYPGNQPVDSIAKATHSVFTPNIFFGYQFHNWVVSIGLGANFSKINAHYSQTLSKTVETRPETIEIVGSYVKNGQTFYFYDTIPALYETKSYDTTQHLSGKISYWNIPLKVGHKFTYKNAYLLPQVGVAYNFTTQSQRFTFTEIALPQSYWSGNVELNIGLQILKRVAMELGAAYQRQLTQVNPHLRLHQTLGHLKIKYSF